MSEIKVNKISPQSGTALEIGDSGDTIDLSAVTVTLPANSVNSDQYVDGSIDTIHIGDNQVTGAKLNPSLVAGDVIYADGTDTINRLAKGTAAQVLAMNAGATAPEWVDAAGGAWTAKSSGSVTTSSGLEVTGITGTTMIFLNLKQSGTHDSIILRTSSNGGSSYDSGSADYYRNNWDLLQSESSPAWNKGNLSRFLLHGARGSSNPVGSYLGMSVRIIRPQDSFSETHFLSDYTGIANVGSGNEGFHGHSGGYRNSIGIVNAIQIKSYSGTMTGTYEIIHL